MPAHLQVKNLIMILGKQTVPNIIPNNFIFADYIIPKVTKYAEITNGKKEYGSLPAPASL